MAQNEPASDEMLDTAQAAALLGVKESMLVRWRAEKRESPPPIRLGHRTVRYRRSDIDALIEQRRQDG